MSTAKLNGSVVSEDVKKNIEKKRVRDDDIWFFWTLDKLYKYYDSIKEYKDKRTGQAVQPVREDEV